MNSAETIDSILQRRRIVVMCGTGGVGKTTLSAALAMRAAALGKKAAVITIDPAKRLATSLGIDKLGDEPLDLTAQLRAVEPGCKGTLAAVVPDTRHTLQALIESLAARPEMAQRIIRNPIFQIFAREFSGTNEYMAMERLLAIAASGKFDTIILDTPPSRNTLAFLRAPALLSQFFDDKIIKWLVLPSNQLVAGGVRKALGVLEKLTGAGFMTALFDFAAGMFDIRVQFQANLKKILTLLESEEVGFVLVTAPTPETRPEVEHFVGAVREHRFRFDGVVVNRSLGYLYKDGDPTTPDPSLSSEADAALRGLVAREREALGRVGPHWLLPELARDVHSIEDLAHVARAWGDSRLPR